MKENESLDALFFELASEDRLNILRELRNANLKMQELARKLDLTATEASRQLQRMCKAKLIERLSDGAYTVTQYGKLTLFLTSSMDFTSKHKQYFLDHDVWQLPFSYVYRLGELSNGVLLTELGEVLIRWEELIKAAEDHLWVMTPQIIPTLSPKFEESLQKGVKIRCINPEQLSSTSMKYMLVGRNVERRFVNNFNFGILATEKEATITLPFTDGTPDPTSFIGNDTLFLKWIRDLFFYYWERAKI